MSHSKNLFTRSLACIPGGVNSPVRAFKGVGGEPIFFEKGKGAYLIDVDGKHYIDYVGSWGPMILGHNHPAVKKAVKDAVDKGLSFGAPTELEVLMAEKITALMPNIEKVRMVNSGTEATMTAIRLARGVTGRRKIVKFAGCYHGHSDSLLVNAGSGLLSLGIPSSKGVPESIVEHTLTVPFNDLTAVKQVCTHYQTDIAAIIIEPVAGNMGCILPQAGFLAGLRTLCDEIGALLIFDEVMTGFRVALGGAQSVYQVKPDLTTLGKVIGGGMPVGAVGGLSAIMDHLAPVGEVYQAGTLSGNPIAMAAGLATLNEIASADFYDVLSQQTYSMVNQLKFLAEQKGIPFAISHLGGMFGFCFSDKKTICSFEDVNQSNIQRFQAFFHGMLQEGIYFAPSAYEAGFISASHGEEEIDLTIRAAEKVFETLSH